MPEKIEKPKKWTRLMEARKMRGYTQTQIAEAVGVSLMTYQRWEALKFEPSVSQIRSIAFILEVPVGWLVGDTTFEPYASAEYFYNVTRAKQMIYEQRDNPSGFLFGENKPVDKNTIIAWVTDKLGVPFDYFEFKDIMPAFPEEFRYLEGDNEVASHYFPIIPLNEEPLKKEKKRKRRS